jgi:hypothetical protein
MTDARRLLVYMTQNRSTATGWLSPRQARRAQHKLERALRRTR